MIPPAGFNDMDEEAEHHAAKTSGILQRFAVVLATGLGVGLVVPIPGTIGALWGLPLSWAVGQFAWGWQLAALAILALIGVPMCTIAGRVLGGRKDNQAIVWDEISTVPWVFVLVPMVNWRVALAGFLCIRVFDVVKPPPARRAEKLSEGLGVMADDWIAAIYASLTMYALAWLDATAGWQLFSTKLG